MQSTTDTRIGNNCEITLSNSVLFGRYLARWYPNGFKTKQRRKCYFFRLFTSCSIPICTKHSLSICPYHVTHCRTVSSP